MRYIIIIFVLLSNCLNAQDLLEKKINSSAEWRTGNNSMILSVEFHRESQRDSEVLQIEIVKNKVSSRPDFISIKVPESAINGQGITLAFHNKERKYIEISKTSISNCMTDCSFVFEDAYFNDERKERQIDVFERMKSYDYVYISWKDHDNFFVATEIPLNNFIEKYNEMN